MHFVALHRAAAALLPDGWRNLRERRDAFRSGLPIQFRLSVSTTQASATMANLVPVRTHPECLQCNGQLRAPLLSRARVGWLAEDGRRRHGGRRVGLVAARLVDRENAQATQRLSPRRSFLPSLTLFSMLIR